MKKPFYQKVHRQIDKHLEKSTSLRATLAVNAGPYLKGHTGIIEWSVSFNHDFSFVPDGPGPALGVGLFELQFFSIPSIGLYEGVVE